MIQTLSSLKLGRIGPGNLRKSLCRTYNLSVLIVLLKVTTQLKHGCCGHCKTIFEALDHYFHFCSCQEARAIMSETETQRWLNEGEPDELRQDDLRNKKYNTIEIWEFNWRENLKFDESVKKTREEQFPIQTTSEA